MGKWQLVRNILILLANLTEPFKAASPRQVVSVITSFNTRSRKKLNYKTPTEKMAEHVAALAA
jgi:IS30 family transposase